MQVTSIDGTSHSLLTTHDDYSQPSNETAETETAAAAAAEIINTDADGALAPVKVLNEEDTENSDEQKQMSSSEGEEPSHPLTDNAVPAVSSDESDSEDDVFYDAPEVLDGDGDDPPPPEKVTDGQVS